jgi:AcrR family transcriptional regulator
VATSSRPRPQDGSTEVEQRIFAATERALDRIGAGELSVADILKEAGIARGTFYHYFGSKWEVINKLAANVMQDIEERMRPFVAPGETATGPEQLHQSIHEGCQIWAEHRAVVRAITEHWRTIPELHDMWTTVFARFTTEIADAIDRQRTHAGTPDTPPSRELAATLLWSTSYVLYLAGLGDNPDLPNETTAENSLNTVWTNTIFGTPQP